MNVVLALVLVAVLLFLVTIALSNGRRAGRLGGGRDYDVGSMPAFGGDEHHAGAHGAHDTGGHGGHDAGHGGDAGGADAGGGAHGH